MKTSRMAGAQGARGEGRLDRLGLKAELARLCEEHSDFRNFCVTCKMLVAKVKRADGKGFSCRHDKPRTPCARVLESPAVPQDAKDALRRRKEKINGVELYHRILKRLRRIRRLQDVPADSSPAPVRPALAPCSATPAGTASALFDELGWFRPLTAQWYELYE